MEEQRNWIIISTTTRNALYGFGEKTLLFSSEKIAEEIAEQFFQNSSEYIIFNIKNIVIQNESYI